MPDAPRSHLWNWAIQRRLEGLRLPPTREAEITEELSLHLQDRYDDLRAGGTPDEAARRAALDELDATELVRALTGLDRPGPADPPAFGGAGVRPGWLNGLWHDIRFGARLFTKDVGATTVIVVTLGLAIAANAIVFGFTDLLLLRPLPIANTARTVTIFGLDNHQSQNRLGVAIPDFLEIRSQTTSFAALAAMTRENQSLTGSGEPRAVLAALVTANLLSMWQVLPVAGRTFASGEDAPGRGDVAVLGHRFWATHFGADAGVVGRALTLNGRRYSVIGVLSPAIEVGNLVDIDVWLPLETAGARRDDRTVAVFGLLAPQATASGANAELSTIAEHLRQLYPVTNADRQLRAMSLRDSTVGRSTWVLLSLLGIIVGLVLVVACANVATVMLSRASARRREIAVRVALGATRARLVRQLVSEGLLVGLASGGLGLLLAYGGLTAFKSLSPEYYFQSLAINGHLLVFALALSIVAPILFGVMPALQSSRPDLNEDLKDGGRDAASSVRGNRSRSVLVVAQVGFALAVLIVSGLIVRTVQAVEHVPLGIQPHGVLTVRVRFDPPKYTDDGARARAVESMLERLGAVPGVSAVSAMADLPLIDGEPTRRFAIVGHATLRVGELPWAVEARTQGDFDRAMGASLVEGRMWRADDRASRWQVAVVNREAVRRYWPGRSPVGDRITMFDADGRPAGDPMEIVGVMDNVVGADVSEAAPPRVYRPLVQRAPASVAFAVRALSDLAAVAPAVREALRSADRDLAVSEVQALDVQTSGALRTFDLIMSLFAAFAAIGLVVAVTGVYGVTAFSVGQRRHEIGVRLALGATAGDIIRLILARSVGLMGIGVCVGVVAGLAIGRGMSSVLVGVTAADPVTYLSVVGLLGLSGLVASYVPAHRALSIDPVSVLKRE